MIWLCAAAYVNIALNQSVYLNPVNETANLATDGNINSCAHTSRADTLNTTNWLSVDLGYPYIVYGFYVTSGTTINGNFK
jgi:hypothetical protein